MKAVPCEDGIIYHYMKKYRRRRFVTVILLTCLFVVYAFSCRAYLLNAVRGAQKLDVNRFSQEVQIREVGERFELHRSESRAIDAYALKSLSYWQDLTYEFEVQLVNPVITDIAYTMANTDSTSENSNMKSAVLYTAEIGGIRTLVLTYPHCELKNGDVVSGIFTAIPRIIEHDVASSSHFEPDSQICAYMLDTRGISMESQFADILFCVCLFTLILYLAVKLIFQYITPLLTPTYRGIDKYGSLTVTVPEIEMQLLGKVQNRKISGNVVTEDWIVSKDTFKLKIVKNHMKKH